MHLRFLTPLRVIELLAALALAAAVPAWASEVHHFDIPEEAASVAIHDFGEQAHVQILAAGDAVKGKKLHAVQGEFSTEDALNTLLDGSGLTHKYVGTGSIALLPVGTAVQQSTFGVAQPQDNGKGGQAPSGTFLVAQAAQGQAPSASSVEGRNESAGEEGGNKKQEQLREIVVTGTHIHGSANDTARVIVIDRQEIDRSGFTTTQQLVDSIPQNFRGGAAGATEDGPLGPGNLALQNDSFATGLNLRGLGPSSTLVLINGHRVAPTAFGIFVDVSTIPLAAIDRVEILTDGASAIYGSDAVAGVVNFILRKDYDGQQTSASYGSGTDGTHHQDVFAQSLGRTWTGGSAVGTVQYQESGDLSAADRAYTSSAVQPTYLLPVTRQYSGLYSLEQDLPAGLSITSDALYTHSDRIGFQTQPGFGQGTSSVADIGAASVGLAYQITEQWRIEATGSYSLNDNYVALQYTPQFVPQCTSEPCPHFKDTSRVASGDIVADGTLFPAPGGAAKLAIGSSYRKEASEDNFVEEQSIRSFERHVTAEFAELEVPVVGANNALPGVNGLDVSLAVRHDDYSDFGSTTNPRYGLAWRPVKGVRVRGAYSTSYRAPSAYEESTYRPVPATLYQDPWPVANGGSVPILFNPVPPASAQLEPEKSRNWTAGLEFEPQLVQNLKFSLDYFNIHYRDRIISPQFQANALDNLSTYGPLIEQLPSDAAAQAYINNFVSQGGSFANFTTVPPGAGVRYLVNAYETNAPIVTTSGFDLTTDYRFSLGLNNFDASANVSYIDGLTTYYTAGASPTNLVNTYSNPLHWRGRGQLNWSRGPWSVNAAVNFSGSYIDTTAIPTASIASWTTVDLLLAYTFGWPTKTSVSLSCVNLSGRDPPYVAGTGQLPGSGLAPSAINYDISNANPLGRVLMLAARVDW